MVIPAKEFKAALMALNKTLGKKKIKTLKRKKEDIIKDFTDVVLSAIENDATGDLPEIVIDFYNDHIAGGEDEDGEDVPEKKDTKKKSGLKKSKTGAKKTDKKKSSVEVDAYGARKGSGTSDINTMLIKGATIDQISDKIGSPKSRVRSHLYTLGKKGHTINKNKDGVLKLAK